MALWNSNKPAVSDLTLDGVLSDFTRALTRLDKLSQQEADKVDDCDTKINVLTVERDTAASVQNESEAIASNFRKLLNVDAEGTA